METRVSGSLLGSKSIEVTAYASVSFVQHRRSDGQNNKHYYDDRVEDTGVRHGTIISCESENSIYLGNDPCAPNSQSLNHAISAY
jgi:hypothetical protein